MYALWHLCAHAYMTTCSHVSAAAHVQQHGRCARQQTFRSPVNEHLCGKMTAWRKSVDVVVLVRRHELNITHEDEVNALPQGYGRCRLVKMTKIIGPVQEHTARHNPGSFTPTLFV
ncbi:hypothetical protein SCLCIDRAFT_1216483 [Scleroderma citrinum Foug A]|uniref:Uncharacterized protein n=1 Tax=Scleroderma citrinum Foug A TaxID=1036808 RepID=A0A0C3DY02_9AGAM|nr:hypothetical protein SCLCIDRAFT_1216483 [Scleroderma citrinum Foug A]